MFSPALGRKEMSKMRKVVEEEGGRDVSPAEKDHQQQQSLGSKVCGVMKLLMGLTRELISGPATTLSDCLEAFFDTSELTGENTPCVLVHRTAQSSQGKVNMGNYKIQLHSYSVLYSIYMYLRHKHFSVLIFVGQVQCVYCIHE